MENENRSAAELIRNIARAFRDMKEIPVVLTKDRVCHILERLADDFDRQQAKQLADEAAKLTAPDA